MNESHRAGQFLPSSLRALILASAFWVLSISLTTTAGSVSAFAGCLLACLFSDTLIRRSPLRDLRPAIVLLGAIGLIASGLLVSSLMADSPAASGLLGPMLGYQVSQSILWFGVGAGITAMLRYMAWRGNHGRILEILFVASAFVVTLAAHRQGMIHRPYFIGDFAFIRGIDPSSILMAIGASAILALSALLMMERNQRRLPYHFTVLALLCFSLLAYVQWFGLPSPRLTDSLGLTGESASAEGSASENPFQSFDNDPDDREAPVAVVLFRDDYTPDNGTYYFRETAYSQFNNGMLRTARSEELDRDLAGHFPDDSMELNRLPDQEQRREVRTTVGVLSPHRTPFGLDAPVRYTSTPNPNSLRFNRTYEVTSRVPEYGFPDLVDRDAGSPDWSIAQWDAYTRKHEDERYGELAEEITSGLKSGFSDDPYAQALAVKDYLDKNGIYSLEHEHAYADDPAASFLFGDLTGYCTHFAYAATYMYRSLGIPSRVGVGYAVPARNRAGGSSLLIQAVNGHAWPEIYLEGVGWVIVDPSPAQTLVDMSVDPQEGLQQMLGDMLREDASFEAFREDRQAGTSLSLETIVRSLAGTAVALLLAAWLIRFYRRLAPRMVPPSVQYRISYRAALDLLAAYGLRRRYGESREAFARRLADRLPAFAELSRAHLDHALRPPAAVTPEGFREALPGESGRREDWLSLYRQVVRQTRARHPLWRSILAELHPCPWLLSR